MKRLKTSILWCLLLLSAAVAEAAQKPNIVFILADDLGYGDLACFGGKDIKTPNIDSLARDGMKLTSFYVHQRCSPSRLAFITGSYAHRAGTTKVIYRRDRIGINPAEITTPELLKQAGYTCGLVGKWHLGDWEPFHPLNHGFDYFKGAWHVGEGAFAAEIPKRVQQKVLAGAPELDLNSDGTITAEELKAGRDKLPEDVRAVLDAYLNTQGDTIKESEPSGVRTV